MNNAIKTFLMSDNACYDQEKMKEKNKLMNDFYNFLNKYEIKLTKNDKKFLLYVVCMKDFLEVSESPMAEMYRNNFLLSLSEKDYAKNKDYHKKYMIEAIDSLNPEYEDKYGYDSFVDYFPTDPTDLNFLHLRNVANDYFCVLRGDLERLKVIQLDENNTD